MALRQPLPALILCAALLGACNLTPLSPSRAVVETRHPILGVHTRLTDEVEPWKIDRTLEMVREMGATWAVEYFPWYYMEPGLGRYDWRHSDLVIDAAHRQGLTLIARVDGVPEWARPPNTTNRYVDERVVEHYADFVAAFVRRYRDRVRYLILWNEPNTTAEWGFRPVSAREYVRLLQAAYARAKEADPTMTILSAGLAPTLEQSDVGLDDLVYLQQMYDAGARPFFDVLNVHAYGWKAPPDDPPAPDRMNFARGELIRSLAARNGDGDKPVMITEGGWNDHPRWTRAVRPGDRVRHTVRALQKAETEWPWLKAMAFWAFRLPVNARNYNDYYTFVDVDFRPKPIYQAVQNWARWDREPGS